MKHLLVITIVLATSLHIASSQDLSPNSAVALSLKARIKFGTNYCNSTLLCESHIQCMPSWDADFKCPADVWEGIVNKTSVLEYHNSKRQMVARGEFPPLPMAYKMPTLQWDSELEDMARARALTCNPKHDPCMKTVNYPWTGQNICWYDGIKETNLLMETCMGMWFNEVKNVGKEDVLKYKTTEETIGHFTTMVQDKGDKVGCAVSFYDNNKSFVVCNYAFNNVRGFKVYSRTFDLSRVGAGCLSGKNPNYPALCSINENVENKPSSNDDDPFVPAVTTATTATTAAQAATSSTTRASSTTTTVTASTARPISVEDLFYYDISNWFRNWFTWW